MGGGGGICCSKKAIGHCGNGVVGLQNAPERAIRPTPKTHSASFLYPKAIGEKCLTDNYKVLTLNCMSFKEIKQNLLVLVVLLLGLSPKRFCFQKVRVR